MSKVDQRPKSANNVVRLPQLQPIKNISSLASQNEVFRQRRVEDTAGLMKLQVGNQYYRLLNWSRTGLAFEVEGSQSPFPTGLKIGPASVFVGDIRVYSGDIEVRSVRSTPENTLALGAEFKTQLFLVEGIESASRAQACLEQILSHETEMTQVSPDICKLIVTMGSSLQFLKQTCDEQEERLKTLTYDEREECLNIFLPSITEGAGSVVRAYNQKLSELLDIDSIPEGSIYHKLFEQHIYPLFSEADFPRRAVEKPRGYAGDYEMMNQIYRGGYEGSTLFAKVLHGYMINEDTGHSVRFRIPYFTGHMEAALDQPGQKAFLSIASGPAIEVQEVISRWHTEKLDRVMFHLLDLDRKALEHAQSKIMDVAIAQNKNPNIEFINASVKNFLTNTQYQPDSLDLIYSGGLFDYLDQLTSKLLVHVLYKLLKKNGKLVIGNFMKNSTSKGFLHILFQWHLIHRTESEMREWAEGLEACEIKVDYDPKHINGFLVLTKK